MLHALLAHTSLNNQLAFQASWLKAAEGSSTAPTSILGLHRRGKGDGHSRKNRLSPKGTLKGTLVDPLKEPLQMPAMVTSCQSDMMLQHQDTYAGHLPDNLTSACCFGTRCLWPSSSGMRS